ncbi:hypothetical protein SPRG_05080 [Saprolegnia parasitica CBS 223.65]|uniref:Metalloendopeptidase n=1 Tax=Saprolegnia parasitica (strain CBS 223.65) TaxID=695850 RepID=A0A067CI04_SAPPC|nr:hypothetical protein SPRG_05080 [Saprolegnia parasitica CBS 223.65]KDO30369.1 hypothetical protein SPRG_05080 [Saprolegnia parasitica CBS 223.65]|eukprot:XP_012198979.1 hypothetical protein SPRG_05080 [Saprolegnia parasitica CBS 223.65]
MECFLVLFLLLVCVWLRGSPPPRDSTFGCSLHHGLLRGHNASSYLTNGQLRYLVGEPHDVGAIYQVCDHGTLTCYEEDGTADGHVDDVVACPRHAQRRLGVASDKKRRLWPDAVLCYEVASAFTASERAAVFAAMKVLASDTGLAFVARHECAAGATICGHCQHYVSIEQDPSDKRGTFAEVGYRGKAGQKLNLLPRAFNHGLGSLLHELLHAFGVVHEHAHPAATAVVLRNTLGLVARSNYVLIKEALVTMYDVHSIMHYGHGLCLPKNRSIKYCAIDQNERDGCVVATPDDCDHERSNVLGQRRALSKGDVRSVQLLYGLATTVTRDQVQAALQLSDASP